MKSTLTARLMSVNAYCLYIIANLSTHLGEVMDKRNSKESLLNQIAKLQAKLERVYQAGEAGIYYVGAANYASRQAEALENLEQAMESDIGLEVK